MIDMMFTRSMLKPDTLAKELCRLMGPPFPAYVIELGYEVSSGMVNFHFQADGRDIRWTAPQVDLELPMNDYSAKHLERLVMAG